MSLKARIFSVFAVLAAFTAFSAAALAQDTNPAPQPPPPDAKGPRRGPGGPDGFRRGPGGPGGGPMAELRGIDLTDAQKQQIKSILDANKPDSAAIEQRKALAEARRDGTLTDEQKEQLKADRKAEMEKAKTVHDQIFAVLTPEQVAQVKKNEDERRERFKQQRQGPPPPPPAKPTDNN